MNLSIILDLLEEVQALIYANNLKEAIKKVEDAKQIVISEMVK